MAGGDDFNGQVIEEFRANGGQVGDSYAIFASAGGQPRDPQWFRNLVAHPDVTVEVGSTTVKARARVADPAERATIWTTQKERMSNFAEYEKSAAPREIPVVLLDPVA